MGIRIGVFVCDCGSNIAATVNVPSVAEYAKTLDDVVFVDEGKWICSVDFLAKIKEYITEHELDRVVVACCTPRTHEPTFKSTVKEAGLNPYLLEFVSIREQCSWVHKEDIEKATAKAKDLVRMGIAKARLLEPAEETRIEVGKDCLVIGGGTSGITSALSLADQDINVTLVEKSDHLGGLLSKIDTMAPYDVSTKEFLDDRKKKLVENEKIMVKTNSEITEINGYVGNFKVKIKEGEEEKEHDFSTIVVATGMRELEPHGQFEFDENDKVVTQLQLEELLRNEKVRDVEIVSIINCVNSRNEERGCCNVGCLISVKNAKEILKRNPNAKVYLFFKDINIRGTEVKYFKDAIEQYDIKLVRYADDTMPVVVSEDGKLIVRAHDVLIGRDLSIPSDVVVLTPPFVGDESTEKLKGLLKVSTNSDGFFQEAHIKLRPLDFATQGIYLGGCTRSPKDMRESMEEAMGASMRASIPMRKGYVEAEGIVADINYELCSDCGLCGKVCEFSAIELDEKHPTVIKAICKGCGTCAAECPKDAINIIHFTDDQILAQVEASLEEKPRTRSWPSAATGAQWVQWTWREWEDHSILKTSGSSGLCAPEGWTSHSSRRPWSSEQVGSW